MGKLVRYVAVAVFVISVLSGCERYEAPNIDLNAKSAVIMDAENGRVFYEKNADETFPPASTAKVMTAIIAIENSSLDKEVVPTKESIKVEPTIIGLKPGVKYAMGDLVSAILIKSANDAARVIAFDIAGSEENFAVIMNEKAKKIGMENTYFATASGLPTGKKDSQYTTARDLARMMKYAAQYEVILDKISKKEDNIYGSDKKKLHLKTHNKTLFKRENAPWGKTGYTREARRTFAGVDPSYKPKIVFTLLKSNDLWNDIFKLNDNGLELYETSHRPLFTRLKDWVMEQRKRYKRTTPLPA